MVVRYSTRALDALDTALQPERVRDLGWLPTRPGLGELTREGLIEIVVDVLPPPAAQDEHERRARAGGGGHLALSRSRSSASEKVGARG
jgi:hypothetical protein